MWAKLQTLVVAAFECKIGRVDICFRFFPLYFWLTHYQIVVIIGWKNTLKFGYNELGYNELGYNELGYNELGYNELGYNELGYNDLDYNSSVLNNAWL